MTSIYSENVLLEDWAANGSTFRHKNDTTTKSSSSYFRYYASCYVAGGLSSGIRWVLTPLELVKTRAQVAVVAAADGGAVVAGGGSSMFGALRSIYAHQGASGLFRGLQPTAAAYWLQTSTKYSLYEVLKKNANSITPQDQGSSSSSSSSSLVYVASAATAEAVASVLMCPFEMLRAKVMTNPNFPTDLKSGLQNMMHSNNNSNMFGSLGPLLARQIPGTVVNFYTFETAVRTIYKDILQAPKSDFSPLQQLGVTFCAGYTAGFCAAVISHPADSLVSLLAQQGSSNNRSSIWQIVHETGLYQLATKGLAPRILITGNIISVQWLLYDTFKSLMGYGTSGGG